MRTEDLFDILVIGGGINGVGIARDAAGRGLKTLLCEKDDLASWTSSASTKLIHGGLRYLEHYEFRLVREALKEREVLLASAPHISWPLRFVLPHNKDLRPAWLIRLGLFLYDHLGKRERLPGSCAVDLTRHCVGTPLVDSFTKGFIYSDAWVQDARMVVLNAMDARNRGAEIRTRTRCIGATRLKDHWDVRLVDGLTGETSVVRAKLLVNAAGPWMQALLTGEMGLKSDKRLRLVKGSHIVVPRLFDHDHAYIFQNHDKRIVFAIPYENDFTLIGTTDVDHEGDPADVQISQEEISYLCQSVSSYFKRPVKTKDVVWSYAGVRPLFDNGESNASQTTRDYAVELVAEPGSAPALNVLGGKLTTYRKLAQASLSLICGALGIADKSWTAGSVLPGGDIPDEDVNLYIGQLMTRFPWLPVKQLERYVKTYGTRVEQILDGATCLEDLGACLEGDLYTAEVRYLVDEEWALTGEDILWRRTKLGLHLSGGGAARLDDFLVGYTKKKLQPVAGFSLAS
ncbi:glycerol-3-phosphate dehydrogenase [Kiloniella laminariae]|uniref:Glycerol-3-phosphate dehydrogenase n=1 Tax=Kiloniella laminariae TaxID=454162 RepID=A0ABT4LKA2_9PROT|nr:glycerol-3-phosphate dehydrogenase [Kiloniella laminariae]MCZ4281525.1 glycerol-3-phosphate dehydrogenase [Kiloniella laminariae]